MSTIYTKLHEAMAVCATAADSPERELLDHLGQLPHFTFERGLANDLDRIAMTKSMAALKEAGVMRLPYPEMFMELWGGTPDWRLFMGVREGATVGTFQTVAVEWWHDTKERKQYIYPMFRADFEWNDKPAESSEAILGLDGEEHPADDFTQPWGFNVSYDDHARRKLTVSMGFALMIAVMMVNISGLERETVDAGKLNKHRLANGKRPIPTHTVVRIGHVYNASGQKVAVNHGTRGSMSIHMRAAHTKRQPHGQRWMDENPAEAAKPGNTSDHHVVFIPAVLVNFKDGAELATPVPKVVRF